MEEKMEKIKIYYRGWPGHFICGYRCVFHLNTLIEFGDIKVVVSTVGLMRKDGQVHEYDTIGHNRHFETMAFHAKKDGKFWDADVTRQINFESEWAWESVEDEWKANKGHLAVVEELSNKLRSGQTLISEEG